MLVNSKKIYYENDDLPEDFQAYLKDIYHLMDFLDKLSIAAKENILIILDQPSLFNELVNQQVSAKGRTVVRFAKVV